MTTTTQPVAPPRTRSFVLIVTVWAALQLGGLFTPGLLDDVDSVYIQIAREMLQRHDYVTPTIDGVRFFDKPPLMYWLAAGSMRLFGVHDWTARLPLALGVLALLFAVYALANRLYRAVAPVNAQDRAGLYAALITGTCLGIYLYTRFFIPDVMIALWMTLAVHLFLVAVERTDTAQDASPLLPMFGFAAVLALDVLTKGLIGVVFPVLFALLYLACTRQLHLLKRLHLIAATLVFFLIAAPWHILAALRNPAVPMPAGVGLPARAGWVWFYLYNEHIARFIGQRIPHDYGQVPRLLFWLLLAIWLFPWAAFLPSALLDALRELRSRRLTLISRTQHDSDQLVGAHSLIELEAASRRREAALALTLWAVLILGFFTIGSRQEYYHLPALPALAVMLGGLLAAADSRHHPLLRINAQRHLLLASKWFLAPLGLLIAAVCGWYAATAPAPQPGETLFGVLNQNPDAYTLSLGHLFDLTGRAMGFFRGPLILTAVGMLTLGPLAWLVRRTGRTFAANLTIALGMVLTLTAMHGGLARFYPILGSKALDQTIESNRRDGDVLIIDGELTSGSTLLFYTNDTAHHVLLMNDHGQARINGPWFGSFWPDAPPIFPDAARLHALWAGPHRVFLLTYDPAVRTRELSAVAPVHTLATDGGKTVLTNR